jgi:hypothetical protein
MNFANRLMGLFVLILLISGNVMAAQRMVVLESFTNTGCVYCPPEDQILDQITHNSDYDSMVAIVRYHVNWPDPSDPYYLFDSGENNARTSYYSVTGVPYGRIDGNLAPNYSSYVTIINNEYNDEESPVTMSLSGDFNPDSDTGYVIVTTFAEADSGYTSLKLRVVLAESGIHWVHPPSVAIHNQTFRDLTPNANGRAITLTVGESRYDTFTFVARSPINADSCEIVAFIQSDRTSPSPTKRILQGTKITIPNLSLLDPTGVNDRAEIPNNFALQQNYPNPFNAQTQIGFNTKGGAVKLEVFNITGAKVTTLIDGNLAGGHHTVIWDGRNSRGTSVSSGMYFYRLNDPAGSQVRRMTLLK